MEGWRSVIRTSIEWIARSLGKAGYRGEAAGDLVIEGVSTDTRRNCSGMLFVALSCGRTDGHDYMAQAIEEGAAALLVSRDRKEEALALSMSHPSSPTVFDVPDTLKGLQVLAASWREKVGPRVVGITGSSGKTGTKELISLACSTAATTHATAGNFNNHIGLPLTILGMDEGTKILVAEMGANHRGEIRDLCAIAAPDTGVITNIGPGHLEFFGSLKGVAMAKAELVESLPETGTAILPADDEFLEFLSGKTKARTLTFGFSGTADYRIENVAIGEGGGYRFEVASTPVVIKYIGKHHLLNAAAALAAADTLGIPMEKAARAITSYDLPEGRGVVYLIDGITVVDDTYNSNPASLASAVEAMMEMPVAGKRWLVLGDMLELGEKSLLLHGEAGTICGKAGVDGILTLGELSAEISREAALQRKAPPDISHFLDIKKLTAYLDRLLGEGDAVLVKGSRGMHMEELIAELETLRGTERRRVL